MQKVQQETNKVLNIGVVNRFNASVNESGTLSTVESSEKYIMSM